jgi:hypothetical protein
MKVTVEFSEPPSVDAFVAVLKGLTVAYPKAVMREPAGSRTGGVVLVIEAEPVP